MRTPRDLRLQRSASIQAGLLAPVLALALLALPARAATPDARRIARELDAYVRPLLATQQLSGNLLVARDAHILVERSWGEANRELGVSNAPETRFCIASVTKPMTLVLAIQLIQEDKLALADTLGKWIPGFPRGGQITVEHLLRHCAGIPHRVTTEKDETVPLTAADMVEYARRSTFLSLPGEKSLYSSAGYSVLARVLELASGQSYEELIRDRLFAPLGMAHSTHANARTLLPLRAASYVPGLHAIENAPLKDSSFLVGAGSIWSTARDLHRLLRAVASHRLGEGVLQ